MLRRVPWDLQSIASLHCCHVADARILKALYITERRQHIHRRMVPLLHSTHSNHLDFLNVSVFVLFRSSWNCIEVTFLLSTHFKKKLTKSEIKRWVKALQRNETRLTNLQTTGKIMIWNLFLWLDTIKFTDIIYCLIFDKVG